MSRFAQILASRPPRAPRLRPAQVRGPRVNPRIPRNPARAVPPIGRFNQRQSPMPFDSQAERESGELSNQAGDTRASLAARWQAQQEQLGFGAGADNPYSQAAQLKRQYEANARGITNQANANLYAGSTVNAQQQATKGYDEGNKQLEDAFARSQAAYSRGTAQTQRDYEAGLNKIREAALNRAVASEPPMLAVGGGRRRPGVARRQQPAGRRALIAGIGTAVMARRRR